jgi:hypothetical protein
VVTILIERWRPQPLAWVHRAEARAIGAELRAAGKPVRFAQFDGDRAPNHESGILLLRVSDPVMLRAVDAPLVGPASAVAASFAAAGMTRQAQLRQLLRPRVPHVQPEARSA